MKRLSISLAVLVLPLGLVLAFVLRSGAPPEIGAAARPEAVASIDAEQASSEAALAAPSVPAEISPLGEGLEDHAAAPAREEVPVEQPSPAGAAVESTGAHVWNVVTSADGSLQFSTEVHTMFVRALTLEMSDSGFLIASVETIPDGLRTEWHVEGEVRSAEGMIRNGKREGLWTEWHANGERSGEGRYFRGDGHGPWTHWHESGALASHGEYLYGGREGLWTEYHDGGGKARIGPYLHGRAEGPTSFFFPSGELQREGSYFDDAEDGRWVTWHENGKIESEGDYRYGVRQGRWRFYTEDGTLDEQQSGWYESGELRVE